MEPTLSAPCPLGRGREGGITIDRFGGAGARPIRHSTLFDFVTP